MSAIAIIPARGGSTRIPMKNIREFHGKPIIVYSIETAKRSGLFSQIIVSTDHGEIAAIAQAAGAFTVWRPAAMAKNEVGTQEVAAQVLEGFDCKELACVIYPTAPLMTENDLNIGHQQLLQNKGRVDFAMSVGAEPLRDAGQWYFGTCEAFNLRRPLISPRTVMVPIPESRVQDINLEEDWMRAKRLYADAFLTNGSAA